MNENPRLTEIAFHSELGESYGRYAQKVILDRAIPDVRDGLKPVQRRIIYAMAKANNTHDKPYRKAAKTVGDVMGNYHPHGDLSIYEALVRMAQWWKMRYPLVDGHGNFGSMDDDPAAAMRYTEARLSPIAYELLRDIDQDTVAWKPNFDEKELEPVVLPAGFLNLLANGTSGVSAGFATDIPSHNLGELIDAAVALMAKPAMDLDAIMGYLPGPDFPTGGILMGRDGLREAYETGRGKVVLRARHTVEESERGRKLLVFNELPYQVIKIDLVRQIEDMVNEKEIIGVVDARDESDRQGLRVVVELRKEADVDAVLAYLFKRTQLQVNYHFNMVAISRNTPVQMGLRDILWAFLEQRREIVRRRSQYDRDRKAKRLHEVEGLIRAVDVLDEVIAIIRASKDKADARKNLMERFEFTEVQANAILDLRLHRLTGLELRLLEEEAAELRKAVARLDKILTDAKTLDKLVVTELQALKKQFGDPRRTLLEDEVDKPEIDLMRVTVKDQEVVVGVTRAGWIKQSSMASFQALGATRKTSGVRPGDRMLRLLLTRTTHTVLAFTDRGQCYPIPVHQIPEARWGDMGTALVNVCGIDKDERLIDLIAIDPNAETAEDRPEYLLFVTKKGRAKQTAITEFISSHSAGLLAFRVPDDDVLSRVIPTDGQGDLMLLTQAGMGNRFGLDEVSVQGRAARGVIALRVDKGDAVVDALALDTETLESEPAFVVFTRAGRAKLSSLEQMPKQRRGGKGVRMVVDKVRNRHECVALALAEKSGETVYEVVDTQGGEHVVEARKIPEVRRDGSAFTVVTLKDGALVESVESLESP